MGQLNYNFFSRKGAAGGIVNIQPYAINSYLIGDPNADTPTCANGIPELGVGVVQSKVKAGVYVELPFGDEADGSTFEGIVTNNRTKEHAHPTGELLVLPNSAVGVMRYGTIYARVATGATPSYGDPVYMVKSGDEKGYFTNVASGAIAIKGRFVSTVDALAYGTEATPAMVAMVELYNQAQA